MEPRGRRQKGIRGFLADQAGGVSVMAAVGIFVFLGMVALAIDIAHMVVVKSELQKAADAGALAGARGLWPQVLPVLTNPPANPNCATAQTWAAGTAQSNAVDGVALSSGEVSVQVGRWNYATKQFTAGCSPTTNAVRVTTQKRALNMLFARVLGVNSSILSATATVVMDFAKAVGKGSLPLAVNKEYVIPGQVNEIKFNPDKVDNAGWFADDTDSASSATFKDYIVNDSCPPQSIGDIIKLQNGVSDSVLTALKTELAQHPGGWDIFMPVVNTNKFNHSEPIVAFCPARITEVQDQGNPKYVRFTVLGLGSASSALPGESTNYGALAPPKAVN